MSRFSDDSVWEKHFKRSRAEQNLTQMFYCLSKTMVPLVARKPAPQSPQLVSNLSRGASNDQSPPCTKIGLEVERNMYGHLFTSNLLFAIRGLSAKYPKPLQCVWYYASGKVLINASQISGCVFRSFPLVLSFLPSICCSFPFLLVLFGIKRSILQCYMLCLKLFFVPFTDVVIVQIQ